MDKYAYGKWCTVAGKRYMIVDARRYVVEVYVGDGECKWFAKEVVTDVSDFMETDAERKAKGYAF